MIQEQVVTNATHNLLFKIVSTENILKISTYYINHNINNKENLTISCLKPPKNTIIIFETDNTSVWF